ncbi:malonic semialdehyde reductase [Kitasatospora sp. MMS16-BH015]|uniref:malonic semialdehyde reductase n=1 Tax=Kitasatospora sp. MMS16-BH015 TaxID=2018025 RepID=UPI000CA2A08A|nr:malonic semialdehyde reductase [Kitasatospora sp. MMS16-BH015]AUG79466.1 malonic semialdehyde reductase [Kitasatospora sp. MMS16-BH015]
MTNDLLALDSAAQDLLFREAHTAHAFSDEPVSDEQIQAIYDLVKYAPTSLNQQPLRVVLVRSEEARERLVGLMSDGNKAKVAGAPLTAILAVDNEFHEHLPRLFPAYPNAKDFFTERPAREGSARLNGTLQAGYFFLGIRAAGLAAGPMTGFDGDGITKEFFTDGNHSVLAVVAIGKPGEQAFFPRGERLAFDEVFTTV